MQTTVFLPFNGVIFCAPTNAKIKPLYTGKIPPQEVTALPI